MRALGAAAPSGTTATYPTLADFGHDPWWLVIIKVLAIFVFLLVGVILIVGGLTFFPALALGPVVEHFALAGGTLY